MREALLVEDLQLVVHPRIAERRAQEEAVELRLRQRERALVLDRVLGRDAGGTGYGSSRVTPSTVTWRSAIASSSADCVFGVARLISSTSTTFAKIGPGRNSKSRVRWSKTERPVTSVGWRSGVHWMRDGVAPSMVPAIARASTVFAVPGTSSRSTCPPQVERGEDELDLLALAVDDRLDVVEEAVGDLARAREALGAVRGSATALVPPA